MAPAARAPDVPLGRAAGLPRDGWSGKPLPNEFHDASCEGAFYVDHRLAR
jgi:hypothetical protein